MKFIVTAAVADNGDIYDVEILAKKINGVWAKSNTSIFFVDYSHIKVLEMTDEERAMSIYLQPGYPGKDATEVNLSYRKVRKLSRSFDTLEQAKAFADGKDAIDIYKSKGRWKVEWRKETVVNC